jgi:hypothetical protein
MDPPSPPENPLINAADARAAEPRGPHAGILEARAFRLQPVL